MKIEFLTQDDPLYILPLVEEFFRHYASAFTILQLSCSRPMGKRPRLQLLNELLSLYKPAGAARLLSIAAVSRVLSKVPQGRDASQFYGLEQIARAHNVPFQKIGNPNEPEFVDSVRRRAPDVVVSVACPYILKAALLSVPPQGCINIHHAPLPRYKGMMPTFWQMFHGEKSVGVTIHFMAPKLDEGTALFQDTLEIEPGETLHHLIRRSKRHGAHCIAHALRQIDTNSYRTLDISGAKGSYFTFPTKSEIHEFHRRGLRAI